MHKNSPNMPREISRIPLFMPKASSRERTSFINNARFLTANELSDSSHR